LKTVFPHGPLRTTLRTLTLECCASLHKSCTISTLLILTRCVIIKLRIQRTKYLGAKSVLFDDASVIRTRYGGQTNLQWKFFRLMCKLTPHTPRFAFFLWNSRVCNPCSGSRLLRGLQWELFIYSISPGRTSRPRRKYYPVS
jgi:hypothetical protein